MGLFGNKDVKRLSTSLESGWMALRLPSVSNGISPEEKLQRIGNSILERASLVAAAGRRDDALAAIAAARKPGQTPHEELWNRMLDAVTQQV